MARRGDDFNSTTAVIEKVLLQQKGVKLSTNTYLHDKAGKGRREFDVLVTHELGHHHFTTAIECKDWKRRVDTPVVDAFINKCRDCGVNKMVIVCSKGFTKEALEKATHHGVACLTLTQVESFDWCPATTLTQFKHTLTDMAFKVNAASGPPEEPAKVYHRSPEGLKEMTPEYMILLAKALFDQVEAPISEEGKDFKISIKDPESFVIITESGKEITPSEVYLKLRYKTDVKEMPWSKYDYHDVSSDNAIVSIAKAALAFGKIDGDIVLKRDKEHIQVLFVPHQAKAPDKPKSSKQRKSKKVTGGNRTRKFRG